MLTFIMVIVIGLFVLYFIIAPLLTKFNVKHKVPPNIFHSDIDLCPPEVKQHMEEMSAKAEQLGFSNAVDLRLIERNNTIYLRLLANKKERDTAAILYAVTKVRDKELIMKSIEFCTDFSDGVEVNTRNTTSPHVFPHLENKIIRDYPKVHDLYQLYEFHRQEVPKYGGYSSKILPPEGQEQEELIKSISKDFKRYADVGYLTFNENSSEYVPTWKGAFLMTYKFIATKIGLRTILGIPDKK
jgi:hypothetical protein